jgi:hypothetical protein
LPLRFSLMNNSETQRTEKTKGTINSEQFTDTENRENRRGNQ